MKEHAKAADFRLRRLARSIEALVEKDDRSLRQAREIDTLRRHAAAALFAVCAGFVDELNQLLRDPVVTLDPPSFAPESFRDETANLIQVGVRGRVLQVEFHATPELLSTEDFRVPYTLAGSVRAFNQALLDKDLIEEQHIFYTVERRGKIWRYFDARTYRSGTFDREYLIALMEQLV